MRRCTFRTEKTGKAESTPPSRLKCLERCYSSGDLVEGRVDNLAVLNLGCPFDKSCHGLQHFWVGTGVVSVSAGFVVPQADGRHIDSAGTGECNFVLEPVLPAK